MWQRRRSSPVRKWVNAGEESYVAQSKAGNCIWKFIFLRRGQVAKFRYIKGDNSRCIPTQPSRARLAMQPIRLLWVFHSFSLIFFLYLYLSLTVHIFKTFCKYLWASPASIDLQELLNCTGNYVKIRPDDTLIIDKKSFFAFSSFSSTSFSRSYFNTFLF